jgi:hypothetical protein
MRTMPFWLVPVERPLSLPVCRKPPFRYRPMLSKKALDERREH